MKINISLKSIGKRIQQEKEILLIAFKNFKLLELNWKVVSLSYFSTMALVPLLAFVFYITKGFGLSNHLYSFIHKYLSNDEAINTILGFADNIISSTGKGIYGVISLIVLLWVIVWLILCVEKIFNSVWYVEKSRVWWKRGIGYSVSLVALPVVLTLFIAMVATIPSQINHLIDLYVPFLNIREIILWGFFYMITILIFSAMYYFIPNAKVRFKSAFRAALSTGLAFTVVQFLYLETQVFVARASAVYGVFAAIPLFMVWVNIAWWIVIIGVELTYAHQNFKYSEQLSPTTDITTEDKKTK